ncbi:hypothetical protein SBRCBS47491_007502 [Sporothrix bragantina]|uniref:NB-ARC domain-containing protein n=1 Tax=Sporothrix bragantina TaxID=671064 RepID=A0ABP0CEE2_9PEZI
MGGLVAKQFITLEHCRDPSMPYLDPKRTAFAFLGTPHHGAHTAKLATFIADLSQILRLHGAKTASASEIKELSHTVEDINADFVQRANDFKIISFFEHLGYFGLGTIVNKQCAVMSIKSEIHQVGVNANHQDICRFSSEKDHNYDNVLGQLLVLTEEIGVDASMPPSTGLMGSRGTESDLASLETSGTGRDAGVTNDMPIFRTQNFYGRRDILNLIDAHFSDKTVDRHAFGIYGSIGVGKSWLALQVLHQNPQRFQYRFWVYAATDIKIKSSMDDIAERIGLDTSKMNSTKAAQAIKKWLEQNTGWLIVFDNVENINDIQPFWPLQYSPDCYIIVTSRNKLKATSTELITKSTNIDCFPEEDAVEWFWSRINKNNDRDPSERTLVLEVVRIFGCLPLALDHMACYIDGYQKTLRDFLDEVHASETTVMKESNEVPNVSYGQPMLMAYKILFSSLSHEANDLLEIFSLLDPDRIPIELVSNFTSAETAEADKSITPLPAVMSRKVILHQAVDRLFGQSLVDKDIQKGHAANGKRISSAGRSLGVLRVHRMTQWVKRTQLSESPQDQQRAFNRAVFCVTTRYPRQVRGDSMAKMYPDCLKYTSHLMCLLDYYELNRDEAQLTVSNTFAEVLAHCGWYYFELGDTDSALRMLLAAERLCEKGTQTSGLVYNNLGAVYMLRCEEDVALAYTAQSIADREKSIPRDDPEIQQLAITYKNYANDLQFKPGFDRALCAELYSKALEICENRPGATPHTRQHILCNTAFAYYRWGDLNTAHHYIERAIALHSECGEYTTYMLYALYYYGNIQLARGELESGYRIHSDCLRRREVLQTNAHYTTGVSLHKVGRLEYDRGQTEQAILYLTQAEATFRDYHDDKGLWPRTCLLLGRILVQEGGRQGNKDRVEKGHIFIQQGLKVAMANDKFINDINDDKELDSLVREVYR